jgi:hypothetical protein
MGSSLSKAVRHALGVAAATIILLGIAVTLTGCPVAAELENEERFVVLGGGGPAGCDRVLPNTPSGCNWRAALGAPGQTGYCYKGGCHNSTTQAGELDLTADDFLISRLLNVPAAHDLTCPGNVVCDPAASTCPNCAMCGAPGRLLIDKSSPGTGWIFDKIAPFVPGTTTGTMNIGCGDAMPTFNTTGTATFSQDHKNCLIEFFTEIAKTPGTWPCVGPPPAGGSGGGGAGGAGSAGAGSGGMPMAGTGGT